MLKRIKSGLILKIIFKNIHNKIKLNIIKYNRYMLQRLDIITENFKVYEMLKELNEILKSKIIDIDIKELGLNDENIGNKGLELLKKVNFKELRLLNLRFNRISDIKILENVNFKELIDLRHQISEDEMLLIEKN